MNSQPNPNIASLDAWFPPAGPCAFCGHADKRHRLWDAIMGLARGGEPVEVIAVEVIAHEYGLPTEAVYAVLSIRPYEDEDDEEDQ